MIAFSPSNRTMLRLRILPAVLRSVQQQQQPQRQITRLPPLSTSSSSWTLINNNATRLSSRSAQNSAVAANSKANTILSTNRSIISSRSLHTLPLVSNSNPPASVGSTDNTFPESATSAANTMSSSSSSNAKKPANTLVEDLDTTFAKTQVFNKLYTDEEDESKKVLLKIAIGKKAASQLKKLMQDDDNRNLALKITVESGGCHGFQYNLKLIDLYKDQIIKQDLNNSGKNWQDLSKQDLVDEEVSVFVRDEAKVVLDLSSLQILRESKVDYVKELIGTSFKVIDSPYTKSACGCGSSFDVDFSKLA